MAGRILVIGSSCVDVILQLDHLPVTEEDMHPKSQRFRMGGCAYNAANILGKAGADVTFVTPVGMKGLFGPFVLRAVEEQHWVHPVRLEDAENGCCYCLVEKDGERTFLSVHGVEYTFSPAWMQDVMEKPFDFIYVSGLEVEERTGDALTAFLEGLKGGTVFYAPGPRILTIPAGRQERILNLHPVLHLNRQEACRFTTEVISEADALTFLSSLQLPQVNFALAETSPVSSSRLQLHSGVSLHAWPVAGVTHELSRVSHMDCRGCIL